MFYFSFLIIKLDREHLFIRKENFFVQIYVVKQGDSLYQIANQFGTSYESIANANEIDPGLSLVVGQALVIPIYGRFYVVRQVTVYIRLDKGLVYLPLNLLVSIKSICINHFLSG